MLNVFYKYQGTGNDFIIIDNRCNSFDKNNATLISKLCHRRFGIGADGLILLQNHEHLDFEMVYFNSDGRLSSMCGNGGRCIVAFANFLGIIENETLFMAVDGEHHARITENGSIELQMKDVSEVVSSNSHLFLDTGSPHHVQIVKDLDNLDVKHEGALIRYSELYDASGSNINFVETMPGGFKVRTYERGVEDETLSCGTGVTAVALAMYHAAHTSNETVQIQTKGGELKVKFHKKGDGYENIWLIGPAEQVFKGKITC
jgi:diaminopimelate epimerase